MERFDITIRVISCVDLFGDLYAALRFTGMNQDSNTAYQQFIKEFFKVFHITAGLLNENAIPLITDIETSFKMDDISLNPITANTFMTHFEDYLFAMKEAGVYDPAVMHQMWNPDNSWEKSV